MLRRILLGAALVYAQTAAPQTPLPTFRTGVDIVELDVTVLDKDRHPVRGLTADDFTILDRGTPQPIVAFSAVDVPAPVSYPAPWMRDAPIDVVSNVENRRLVTIVMDDAYTEFNPDFAKRARQIARNAVAELGPADLAAVIFTFMGQRQNFTSDRTRLFAAIDSYVPKFTKASGAPLACSAALMRKCDIEALSTAASTLLTSVLGRKIAILISGGRSFSFGGPGNVDNEGSDLGRLFRDLQSANITVYAFDARGLAVAGGFSAENRRPPEVMSSIGLNESLHTFAGSTGGRAITNTNDPESHVAETLRESSSYYFIGFRTIADSKDKGLHKVEVKVRRSGLQVHTRTGYYPPRQAAVTSEVINGLPSGNLPVHATAVAVAAPGRPGAEVILVARVEPPRAPAAPTTIELSATAIDLEAKPQGVQRQTMAVTPNASSEGWPDLPVHLPLAPGRYIVQVEAKSEDRAGGVAVDVDVSNFAKDSLSASGLILQRRPPAAIADQALAGLVPFMPTTIREFHADDDVAVFVRIYQGEKGRIMPVRMSLKVRNEKNAVASNNESTLAATNFSEGRSADYEVSLPLDHLSPGEYLLEVDVQSGARHVTRTARFSVVK
jgi:VWFA-related protein